MPSSEQSIVSPQLKPLVTLNNVSLSFVGPPPVVAVNKVSLTLNAGEHSALIGANGAGKSSLLSLIRAERSPDQQNGGTITWFPPSGPDSAPLTGRAMVALVSPKLQEHYCRSGWRVNGAEIILAALYQDYVLYKEPSPAELANCHSLAEALGAQNLLTRSIESYSQGEMRLVLLARALIQEPEILLLDEATDGLDASHRKQFLHSLEALLATQACTVFMSTHRTDHLPSFIRKAWRMKAGVLSPVELRPAAVLGKGPSLVPDKNTSPPALSATLANSSSPTPVAPAHQVSLTLPLPLPLREAPLPTHGELRMSLRNATVFVERQEVLHQINWTLCSGQQWMIRGANGAGKTTLLRTLLGEEPVALGGSIERIFPSQGPEPVTLLADIQRSMRLVSDRLQIQYTYDLTAWDVVFSGLDGSIGVYRQPSNPERADVERCLALVGMEAFAERTFRSLSTGQARRILLARALTGTPDLLLLDEPFSGLDPETRAQFAALLEARMAAGLHIVLVSHYENDRLPSITHQAELAAGRLEMGDVSGSTGHLGRLV